MSQKHTISGRRPALIWLSILIALVVLVALVVIVLFIYPNYQRQQQVEQHYQAGVAFQDMGDWDKAVEAFEKVITLDAIYKDAPTRLAEVKSKQQEVLATAQAKAAQTTATAQARAEATAAAATAEPKIVQATSVAATATARARATLQAQEAEATATAEALAQLEAHYQKGLGYMNIGRWEEAKAELEQVFEADPNYKEVQAKLGEVEEKLTEIRARTPTPMPTTPTPTSFSTMVVVESQPAWTNTGVELQQGDSVRIEYVSGQWKADGTDGRWPWVGPEGCDEATRYYTLPYERLMSLIGRIGQSRPFLIDESREFVADVSGILSLGPNDDIYDDNLGSVTVRITVEKR